jgi:DNA-directed RNA polymerase specialized sigma24 family protein
MFGNALAGSEVEMVAATNEFEAVYEQLRSRMVASVRKGGLHENDVEDVVHDALEKLLSETVRPGAPNIAVRGFTALRDKRAEHYRREARRGERVTALTLPPDGEGNEHERPELVSVEQAIKMVDLRETITAVAGEDAMRFAVLKACGATEYDIGVLLGWQPPRAAAARVQLTRKKTQIAQALLDTLTEGGNTW